MRPHCRPSVLLAILAALFVAPSGEAAVEGLARTDQPVPREVSGLSLAGEAVVWGDLSPYHLEAQTWTVRLVKSGARAQTRFRARVPPLAASALAASATNLAVMPATFRGGGNAARLLAGPLDGPLTALNESITFGGALEWSGTLLAASEGSIGEGARITLRDAGSGFAARDLSREPNVLGVRIGGSRAALATAVPPKPGEREDQGDVRIDVLRLDDGRVEYSVVAQDNVLFDFDLQEDGKIAWLESGYLHDSVSQDGTLYWASAQEPRPHVLAVGVAAGARRNGVSTGMLRVRLANDRAVFSRVVGGWRDQAILQPWVSDLAGTARPIWFPIPASAYSDFDGSRLAVAAGGCVWLGDVNDRLSAPPSGTCPQQVTGVGRRRITRGGSRYAYGIHCLMAPVSGCRGKARLEVAKRERGARKVVAVRRFRAKRGRATQVRFQVSRARLRALRNRAGSVWLFVSVRSTDAAGLTSVTESYAFAAQP